MLANLDNEVIFKKAFTDKIVFEAFVKDVLGLEIEVAKIETEKRFEPKIGHIDFKLDIFAESKDERVIIEIQRIEYDYNFDRFLHYFLMSITELQRSFKAYEIDKEVYAIVVMTAPYKIIDKTGKAVLDEVMISDLNPKNLKGEEICIFNHRLVFLNAYHKEESTPEAIRDWMDLIYESVHHPEDPKINTTKASIRRAAEIIDQENLSPEEWADRKRLESTKIARKLFEENVKQEAEQMKEEAMKTKEEAMKTKEEAEKKIKEAVRGLINSGLMTDEQIANLLDVTLKFVKQIRDE